jgi:hypothetical protein
MNHHRMRALVSNDDLHVVVVEAPALMVYTDLEALHRAVRRGLKIPAFRAGVAGVSLFARAPAGVQFIVVNEGLEHANKLYLSAPHFGHVVSWAEAVAFERRIASAKRSALAAVLKAYDAYLMPVARDQPLGVLFTAPDLLDAYTRRLRPETIAEVTVNAVSGYDVVGRFTVNPMGPGAPRVLTRRPRSASSGPRARGGAGSAATAAFAARGNA